MQGQSKSKLSVYSLTTALLVVGIVILANVVGANLFGRLDLTDGRIYSLSDASRKIVAGLEDDFLVKAYFSNNLPAPYNGNAKYLEDLLADYRTYGKGRFKYLFIEPGDDAKLEEEAQKYRIPPVQVQVVEQDQFQAKKVYMGLVFLYKDSRRSCLSPTTPRGSSTTSPRTSRSWPATARTCRRSVSSAGTTSRG